MRLSAALSHIDYLCGEPNEMQASGYDAHFNEEEVVNAVRRKIEELEAQLQACRGEIGHLRSQLEG